MFIIKRVVSMNGEGFRRVFEDYHELVLHVAYDLLQDHESVRRQSVRMSLLRFMRKWNG